MRRGLVSLFRVPVNGEGVTAIYLSAIMQRDIVYNSGIWTTAKAAGQWT